jgi:pimeloyl-ACP methyl ester carboxylesterase
MFSPTALRFLPFILAEAHAGRFSHLQRLIEAFGEPSFAMGTHLSVQCAEAFPRTTLASIRKSDAQVPAPLGSILSSERYASYCDTWKMDPVKPSVEEATTSVPTLVLSGYFDHLTPPDYARAVVATLPNSELFIDSSMGHGVALNECGAAMVAAFIRALHPVTPLSSAHCQEHTRGIEFSLASPSDAELKKVENELRYRL